MPQAEGIIYMGAQQKEKGLLGRLQKELAPCIQCGTCTASCRNAYLMDFTPRRLWRLVLMGCSEEIFQSRTFALCSSCYYCTLRCPRGIAVTEVMDGLKQLAAAREAPQYRANSRFYASFMDSVRRHGRVNEMEFMRRYFISMKNPVMPLTFAPLGLTLMKKGKISLRPDKSRPEHNLDELFKRVEEVENQP